MSAAARFDSIDNDTGRTYNGPAPLMTPGETKLLDALLLVLGSLLVFSGWRTVIRRRTRTQYGEHQGKAAARIGWFWLVLGILILLAALTRIPLLKAFGRLVLRADA